MSSSFYSLKDFYVLLYLCVSTSIECIIFRASNYAVSYSEIEITFLLAKKHSFKGFLTHLIDIL